MKNIRLGNASVVLWLLVSYSSACLHGQGATAPSDMVAVLSGAVLDQSGAAVVDNSVILFDATSGRQIAAVPLDPTGRYRLSVRAGVYRVTLGNTRDILPYQRAMFRLAPGEQTLNLWPVFRSGVALDIRGDRRVADPSVRFDQHIDKRDPGLEIVIQFDRKERDHGDTVYTGEHLMLSVGLLTVRAKRIQVDSSNSEVRADGLVRIDLDHYSRTAAWVELSPKNRVMRLNDGNEIIQKTF